MLVHLCFDGAIKEARCEWQEWADIRIARAKLLEIFLYLISGFGRQSERPAARLLGQYDSKCLPKILFYLLTMSCVATVEFYICFF